MMTLSQLRMKRKLNTMLAVEQAATFHSGVSSRPSTDARMKQEVRKEKRAVWRIIHYDMLQSSSSRLGRRQKMEKRNRPAAMAWNMMKSSYSAEIGCRVRQKLKLCDLKSTVKTESGWIYCPPLTELSILRLAPTLNLPSGRSCSMSRHVTKTVWLLWQRVRLLPLLVNVPSSPSRLSMMAIFLSLVAAYSKSYMQRLLGSPSCSAAEKKAYALRQLVVLEMKLRRLMGSKARSALIMQFFELMGKLVSSDRCHSPISDTSTRAFLTSAISWVEDLQNLRVRPTQRIRLRSAILSIIDIMQWRWVSL